MPIAEGDVEAEAATVPGGGGKVEEKHLNTIVEKAEQGLSDWKTCLQTVLTQEGPLEQETYGRTEEGRPSRDKGGFKARI